MRALIKLVLAVTVLVPSFAMAYERGYWRGGPRYYHGHPIVYWHGHYGYWIGATWYPYYEPGYPYPVAPVPTASVGVRVGPVAVGVTEPLAPPPPVVVAAPPPTIVANSPASGAPKVWYYCESPSGYYPSVPSCPTAWKQVAATP